MISRYIEILSDWNFWEKKIDTGVLRREYVDKLEWYADFKEVIAVSGIRRSGKSTILRQLIIGLNSRKKVPFENILHINFEDPRLSANKLDARDLFDIFNEYKEKLKPKGKIYVFLDEVQMVSRWEQFVRTLYDLHDKKNVLKFFVTGSNSTIFTSRLATSLTGRIINYFVYPLSYKELLGFRRAEKKDDLRFLEEYLKFGGFPQVVLEKDNDKKRELLISYYNAILENDVILRYDIKNKEKIKELAVYLLSNTGNLISSYALEKILGLGNADISRYIGYLEEAYLVSRLSKFSYSVRKQIYNPDKIYCVDTGLANIAGFNFSQNRGHLLENLVFNKLISQKEKIYYYKEKQEVDFAVFKNRVVKKLINVTLTVDDPQVLSREIGSLETTGKEYPKVKQVLLTLYNQSGQKDKRIYSLIDYLLNK